LLKDEALETVVEAVQAVMRGETLYSRGVLDKVTAWARGEGIGGLTEREREVLRLVAEGKSNQEMAQALCVAEKTIEKHVSSILDKLAVDNRTEAAVWAVRNGLLA